MRDRRESAQAPLNDKEKELVRIRTQDFSSSNNNNAAALTRIYNEQLLREINPLTEAQKKKLEEINQIVAI